jgi:Zn-dependent metalloprotease
MQKQFGFILLILSISSFSFSSQKDKSESQPELKHIIQGEFESSFGKGWQFLWNLNSTPHRIFGQSIPQDFDANDPIASEYAARDFILNHPSLFNIYEENFDLWVNEQHGNLRYLIFNQVYQNIPVWEGRIDFRYRLNGDLVMIGHDAFPTLQINTMPVFTENEAILQAQIQVDFDENLNDEVVSDPPLFIWVEKKQEPGYFLVWLIELFVHSTDPNDEVPVHRWKIFVDAHSGDILEQFDEVKTATVEGHVTGSVKDEPYGLSETRGLPHVKIDVSDVGITYTDENGYYSIDSDITGSTANINGIIAIFISVSYPNI